VVEAALSAGGVRRSIVIVWVVLASLIAAIVALEYGDRRAGSGGAGERDARTLLPVPVDQLGAIEIADRGRLHRFERDAAGTWFYHGVHTATTAAHTHTVDPVLSQRIARAFAAFGRARAERQFSLHGDGAPYGVATPEVVILVYRPNESQPLAQYGVGSLAPDTLSRYVVVVGSRSVVTVPSYQIDNLLGLIQAGAEQPDPGLARRQ
jgi:hypothetical protein